MHHHAVKSDDIKYFGHAFAGSGLKRKGRSENVSILVILSLSILVISSLLSLSQFWLLFCQSKFWLFFSHFCPACCTSVLPI